MPLLLPGRLTRARESAVRDLPELVQLVVEALRGLGLVAHEDMPYFVLGHEFGALVAFEICRRVQEEFPMRGLFVSSMSCPQVCVLTGGTFPACWHFWYIQDLSSQLKADGWVYARGCFSFVLGEREHEHQ